MSKAELPGSSGTSRLLKPHLLTSCFYVLNIVTCGLPPCSLNCQPTYNQARKMPQLRGQVHACCWDMSCLVPYLWFVHNKSWVKIILHVFNMSFWSQAEYVVLGGAGVATTRYNTSFVILTWGGGWSGEWGVFNLGQKHGKVKCVKLGRWAQGVWKWQ